MIYGYVRVSTVNQSKERQVRNIKHLYPNAIILQDECTGTTMDRPQWNRLMRGIKSGDTIVIDSVSRMSRDAEEGCKVYEELYNKGVEIVVIKEPYISTSVYREATSNSIPMTGTDVDCILSGVNEYLLAVAKSQIRIAFEQAQKEVDDLRQRTREGMETARLAGKQIGCKQGAKLTTKKSVTAKEIIKKHAAGFGGSLSDADCMRLAGVSRNSYYKYKKQLKDE